MDEVWEALADPDVRVVAQVAPAVRVAVGDHYSLPKGRSVMGKIVNALHRMGFDEIYDTAFSADLTIMEESAEFLKRVEKGGKLPLLTSCCPAWVKFITDQYKDYIPNLSTCRSPQGMMSAVIKEYFRDPENAKGKKTVMVSIMPCTAKKAEAIRPNSFTDEKQDTDIVITTTELLRMIDNFGLDFATVRARSMWICHLDLALAEVLFWCYRWCYRGGSPPLKPGSFQGDHAVRFLSVVSVEMRESKNLQFHTREWISMYVWPVVLPMQEPLWNV